VASVGRTHARLRPAVRAIDGNTTRRRPLEYANAAQWQARSCVQFVVIGRGRQAGDLSAIAAGAAFAGERFFER
jgi:hypothetical protein